MSRPSFFNDNLGRHYPFVAEAAVPTYAVVDFGCTFFPGVDFDPDVDTVTLEQIRKINDLIEFEFHTTAVAGAALVFRFNTTDSEFTTVLSDVSPTYIGASSSYEIVDLPQDCEVEPVWSGFMTCGDLVELVADLTTPITSTSTVEPSRIQSQSDAYVRSVSVYNADRTRAENTQGCKELCWPFAVGDHYVVAECLTGEIAFKEGYNCEIRQDAATNAITLNAYVGAGEGAVCEQPAVSSAEDAPDARTTLDGGLRCSEVLRSINGVGGRAFTIAGFEGVSVTPVSAEHKLIINVNMVDLQLCTDFREEGEAPATDEYGVDPCDCGPIS